MSWFETVTGTTNAERQAWRDNFNGGYAVGAGASFFNAHLPGAGGGGSLGISKSGSDGQVKGGGNAGPTPTVTTVKHVQPTNTGRGGPTRDWAPTVVAPNQAGGPVIRPGGGVVINQPGGQQGTGAGTGEVNVTQLTFGGVPVVHDHGYSDGADAEDRWGEWGGGAAGLAVMAADGVSHLNSWLADNWSGGSSRNATRADFSDMTSPDWDFGADMRWLNEDRAGSVGGGF